MADKSLASSDDLWGPEFGVNQPDSELLSLLTKQAEALTRRTNGEVVGQAVSSVDRATVWTSLYATVPAIGGYRRQILTIAHPIERSPADPTPVTAHGFHAEYSKEIGSMEELITWLSTTLASDEVHKAIEGLRHYSRESVA
jgi:hypothetical protein